MEGRGGEKKSRTALIKWLFGVSITLSPSLSPFAAYEPPSVVHKLINREELSWKVFLVYVLRCYFCVKLHREQVIGLMPRHWASAAAAFYIQSLSSVCFVRVKKGWWRLRMQRPFPWKNKFINQKEISNRYSRANNNSFGMGRINTSAWFFQRSVRPDFWKGNNRLWLNLAPKKW